jgi:general secretion pathway protein D
MKRYILLFLFGSIIAQEAVKSDIVSLEKVDEKLHLTKDQDKIFVNIVNENLSDLIMKIAKIKNINVELPENSPLNDIKISYLNVPHKVSVRWTWDTILSLLRRCGFSVIPKKNSLTIVPSQNINQEPVPVFVNISADFLPDNDQVVRYLYYFENIDLKDNTALSNIEQILTDILPPSTPQNIQAGGRDTFITDPTYNSILITSTARSIKDVMNIISVFDQTGMRESAVIVPILNCSASSVANIIKQIIPETTNARYPSFNSNKTSRYAYFSDSLRVVPISRVNSLAILGPIDSVQRLKDFIKKYLDTTVDADKITIHIKRLQFLDADKFADVLKGLISAQLSQGGDQSTASVSSFDSILKGVIISSETPKSSASTSEGGQGLQPTGNDVGLQLNSITNNGAIIGGNNLIVGARESDWKIIDRLIDQCDTLKEQVAIEALILNVNMDLVRQLGVQGRGFNLVTTPEDLKWQSAQLGPVYLNSSTLSSTTPDLSRGVDANLSAPSNIYPPGQSPNPAPPQNLITGNPSVFTQGSTTLTYGSPDNGTSFILNSLLAASDTTVVSQPYVITANHEPANIYISQMQRVQGSINPQVTGGQVVTNIDSINAAIELNVLPRISYNRENINLELSIKINEFDSPINPQEFNYTIQKRTIMSNINLRDGEITVLGGLSRYDIAKGQRQVPLLGNIPIIGYLFKNRNQTNTQRVIVVFLKPTIVRPRIAGGANQNTLDRYKIARDITTVDSKLFNNLFDPITSYFFMPEKDAQITREMDAFIEQGEFGKPVGEEVEKEINASTNAEVEDKIKMLLRDNQIDTKDEAQLSEKEILERIDRRDLEL